MKKAIATIAPKPKSTIYRNIAWVYAAILTVMAVAQLFSFEKFLLLVQDYWLPGGYGTAMLTACLVVVCEVFALPFLLRMPLSQLMRWFSMGCAIVAALIWIMLALVSIAGDTAMTNSGMLGTKITVPVGGAQSALAIALLVLAALSSYGLWPTRNK